MKHSSRPYILITGKYTIEDNVYTGYGIGYSDSNLSLSFENLATNPITDANLVKICNDLALSPIHLEDVAEDFLLKAT